MTPFFPAWTTVAVQAALVLGVLVCLLPQLAAWAARVGAGRTRLGWRRRPRWRAPVWRWLHPELERGALVLLVGVALTALMLVAS